MFTSIRMSRFALATTLLLACQPWDYALAQRPPGTVVGYELMSCGRFIEGKDHPAVQQSVSSFARGYMSGANMMRKDGKEVRGELPNSTILLYLEKYCRENPLSSASDGVINLSIELAK